MAEAPALLANLAVPDVDLKTFAHERDSQGI
jgi:hypothetical protein